MANVGDYIKFGNYPQTANGDIQPIEWQVLAKEENKMLVISKYGLEARRFNGSSSDWINSEIRKWLNGEFYNETFDENEKIYIEPFETFSGVLDNIFLLSKEEAEKYFVNDEARKCKATEYAVKNGAWVNSNDFSFWCLSSPCNVNFVYCVSSFGTIYFRYICNDGSIFRPALWINL